jgi:hypothetical protein
VFTVSYVAINKLAIHRVLNGVSLKDFEVEPKRFAAWSLSIAVSCMAVAAVAVPRHLERAAERQCIEHDWPVAAHNAHIQWCVTEGYLPVAWLNTLR